MATANSWTNADGIEVNFGPVISDSLQTNSQHTKGKTKELQLLVDASVELPTSGVAHSAKDDFLPTGAYIVSARYIADVDFDFGVIVGTSQKDGTAIDADGLIAETTTTAEGAGALIGTVVAQDSYLIVEDGPTAGGPATVGTGTLIVEYVI